MVFLPTPKDRSVTLVKNEFSPITQNSPLLLSKFIPPRLPEVLSERKRLLQHLNDAEAASLTLVCAAAGFGKTTLLTQWYRQRQYQGDAIAWLSLEESDNSPSLFACYLLDAIRPLYQGWNKTVKPPLTGNLGDDLSFLLTELINQLHHCPHSVYLILDDYQNIHHPDIHQGVCYLLNHAPASLHIIISSRCRPKFELSRLQMQEQLVEIYDDELRFNFAEAQQYLSHAMTTTLQRWDIQRLVATTEGWITGIKIATLARVQNPDTHSLIRELNVHSHALTRYLEEVIFSPLPAEVFRFLMQTSILNRLHPALCNVVTGQNNGAEMLAWIEQHNLFLSSLDESGTWFRYHPLIRDALSSRLQQSCQSYINQLHERASHWFAAEQQWSEAMRHALAAGKPIALDAELSAQSLAEEGDIETMVRWRHHLPTHLGDSQIDLQLNLAWALAHHFRFNDAHQLLNTIEAWVAEKGKMLPHYTWVKLRVIRGICEALADNIPGSIAIVEPLLEEIPCGDIWVDGLVCNILSFCHLAALRPQQALDVQLYVAGSGEESRNLFVNVYRTFVVAQGHLRQGNLQEAQYLASQTLHDAEPYSGANTSSGATLAPILAAIAWELGETAPVDDLLRPRLKMIDDFAPPEGLSRCYIVLARQALLRGEIQDAEALLIHAEQLATQRGWLGALAPLLAERITFSLKSGNRGKAQRLLHQLQQLARQNRYSKNRLINGYITLSQSRFMLDEGEYLAAAELLYPLVNEQEHCGEWLSVVYSRLLLAIALWRAGQSDLAAAACKPALQWALQQNLLRCLLDTGPELFLLLNYLRGQQPPQDAFTHTISKLKSLLAVTETNTPASHAENSPSKLTEREQQALYLIAEGYPNKSIARSLGISAETVKWHLKHLYEKLEANNRTQAVSQARKLKLLN